MAEVIVTFTRSKLGARIVTATCPTDGTQFTTSKSSSKVVTPQELARSLSSKLWWEARTLREGRRIAAALESVIAQLKKVKRR